MTDQNKQKGHLTDLELAKMAEWLANNPSSELPEEWQLRLDASEKSRHDLAELYRIGKELDSQEAKVVSMPSRSFRRPLRLIAAALIFGLLATLIWYFNPIQEQGMVDTDVENQEQPIKPNNEVANNQNKQGDPKNKETTEETIEERKEPAPVYALLFTSNDNLEPLVGNQVRSSGGSDFKPELDHSIVIGDQIDFDWPDVMEGPFTLLIYNNRAEEVARFGTTTNQLRYIAELPQGLFYWKLENEEDLLYVGKFKVMPE